MDYVDQVTVTANLSDGDCRSSCGSKEVHYNAYQITRILYFLNRTFRSIY